MLHITSTFARADYLRRALAAGVCGYMLKDAPAEDLTKAIRGVHQGGRGMKGGYKLASHQTKKKRRYPIKVASLFYQRSNKR